MREGKWERGERERGKVQREEKGQFSVEIQTRTRGGGPLASSGMRLQSNWEMKIQKQSVTIRVNGKPQPRGLSLPPQAQPYPGEGQAGKQDQVMCQFQGSPRDMEILAQVELLGE